MLCSWYYQVIFILIVIIFVIGCYANCAILERKEKFPNLVSIYAANMGVFLYILILILILILNWYWIDIELILILSWYWVISIYEQQSFILKKKFGKFSGKFYHDLQSCDHAIMQSWSNFRIGWILLFRSTCDYDKYYDG